MTNPMAVVTTALMEAVVNREQIIDQLVAERDEYKRQLKLSMHANMRKRKQLRLQAERAEMARSRRLSDMILSTPRRAGKSLIDSMMSALSRLTAYGSATFVVSDELLGVPPAIYPRYPNLNANEIATAFSKANEQGHK